MFLFMNFQSRTVLKQFLSLMSYMLHATSPKALRLRDLGSMYGWYH